MTRPKYPDDFHSLPVAHLEDWRIDAMVEGMVLQRHGYQFYGDTLVLNSAGRILVFALITQAPVEVKG